VNGAAVALVLALTTVACSGRATAPRAEPTGAAHAEEQALDEALDRLEERLLNDQASVTFWGALRERHASVSAVACQNLGRHAQDMALFEERQRSQRALSKKSRLATRFVPLAESTR
jgi:hypothetical protein